MSWLRATLIDVGWGDSLLVESEGSGGKYYALIDSNDTSTLRSSHIFLKRFFERKAISIPTSTPLFEWVLLTHAHADHGQGLKRTLKDFGTSRLWYPDPRTPPAFFADLLRYAANAPRTRVGQYDVIDTTKILPNFGNATMQVLWPPQGHKPLNENNNSVVLTITLGRVCLVFTGDAEADGVWTQIAGQIPANTRFFKVPHHGSDNGTFGPGNTTPWLDRLQGRAKMAISSHVHPFGHPTAGVINELTNRRFTCYRTDENYHITVETNGKNLRVKYSHM